MLLFGAFTIIFTNYDEPNIVLTPPVIDESNNINSDKQEERKSTNRNLYDHTYDYQTKHPTLIYRENEIISLNEALTIINHYYGSYNNTVDSVLSVLPAPEADIIDTIPDTNHEQLEQLEQLEQFATDLYVLITVIPSHVQRLLNSYNICLFLRKKYNINCQLFVGLDVTNPNITREDICHRFSNMHIHNDCTTIATTGVTGYGDDNVTGQEHVQQQTSIGRQPRLGFRLTEDDNLGFTYGKNWVTPEYCCTKAATKYKIANIVTKIMALEFVKNNIFANDDNDDNDDDVDDENNEHSRYKYFVMLENDALIYDNFIQILSTVVYSLNKHMYRFDIVQLKPYLWCQHKHLDSQKHILNLTKIDLSISSQIYIYTNNNKFALATAYLYDRKSVIKMLKNDDQGVEWRPINRNFDISIAYLINNPFKIYAICPSIVGEIGGNSTLILNETKKFQIPGFQRMHKPLSTIDRTDDTYFFPETLQ